MLNKFLFFILFCFVTSASGNERSGFNIPLDRPISLIEETQTLKIETEETIQKQSVPIPLYFSFLGGTTRPKHLTINTQGRVIDYDFTKYNPFPLLTAQFSYFPLSKRWGSLGLAASLGYSYTEYYQKISTALHTLPMELSVIYRADLRSTQKVIPFVSWGRQMWAVFQRGIEQYNNSITLDNWAGSAGVSFNLNRLKILNSRNETEITFQYKRSFATPTADADLNSDTYQVGGSISL